jgi:hypothetical protein
MRKYFGVNALIGAADQCIALFDVSVDAAVSASPVGMFPEQADAPWNEDFHGVGP